MTTFKKGDIVRHRKNPDRGYRILLTPDDNLMIEQAKQAAYAYQDQHFGIIWVRPSSEMEDGRFSLVKEAAKAAVEERFK